jgi:hypothetical protein
MDRYRDPQTAPSVALHGGLYLAIIMDRYSAPQTAFTIALHGGLYLAIIIERYRGPSNCPYYGLAWRPLFIHYNGPL